MKKKLKTDLEKIAYNCRQATMLIEKKQSLPLNQRERIELKIHLAGCYICRVYEQQSLLISNMISKLLKDGEPDLRLDDEFKEDLKKHISKK